jgi:hypothetical protein
MISSTGSYDRCCRLRLVVGLLPLEEEGGKTVSRRNEEMTESYTSPAVIATEREIPVPANETMLNTRSRRHKNE